MSVRTRVDISGSFIHGTTYAYTKHGCRCDLCTAVVREARRELRARRRKERVKIGGRLVATNWRVRHGTRNAYSNWSCRCAACVAAATGENRQRRDPAKAPVRTTRGNT